MFIVQNRSMSTAVTLLGNHLMHQVVTMRRQAYGDDAMRRAAVFKWWKRFRDGETNVKDESRRSKPPVPLSS
jgi:hypothetical protein